jgi:hypothetical protein
MDIEMNHPASKGEQVVERISLTRTSTIQIGPEAGRGVLEAGLESGLEKEKDHCLAISPSTKKDISGHKSLKSTNNAVLYPSMQHPPSLQSLGVAVYNSNKNMQQPEECNEELAIMQKTATALGEALQSFAPTGRKANKFRAMRRNSFVVQCKPGQVCLPLPPSRMDQGLYVERSQPCRPSIGAAPPLVSPATHFVPEKKSRKFRAVRRNSVVIHQKPRQDGLLLRGLKKEPKNDNGEQPGACTSNQKSSLVRENDKESVKIQTCD